MLLQPSCDYGYFDFFLSFSFRRIVYGTESDRHSSTGTRHRPSVCVLTYCGRASEAPHMPRRSSIWLVKIDVNNNFIAINKLMLRSSVQPQAMIVCVCVCGVAIWLCCERMMEHMMGNRTSRWWWLIQSINIGQTTAHLYAVSCVRHGIVVDFYWRNFQTAKPAVYDPK